MAMPLKSLMPCRAKPSEAGSLAATPAGQIDTAVTQAQLPALSGKARVDTTSGAITVLVPLDEVDAENRGRHSKTLQGMIWPTRKMGHYRSAQYRSSSQRTKKCARDQVLPRLLLNRPQNSKNIPPTRGLGPVSDVFWWT